MSETAARLWHELYPDRRTFDQIEPSARHEWERVAAKAQEITCGSLRELNVELAGELQNAMDSIPDRWFKDNPEWQEWYRRSRAAIAKTKGGQP